MNRRADTPTNAPPDVSDLIARMKGIGVRFEVSPAGDEIDLIPNGTTPRRTTRCSASRPDPLATTRSGSSSKVRSST